MTSSTSSATGGISNLLNTSGITVGSDGKIQVGGLVSGIDTTSLINAQIAADSIPVTNLQTKITTNNTLSTALGTLATNVTALETALEPLRNDLAFGSDNAFTDMAGTGTTAPTATAPTGYTPSDINTLLTTSFNSKAQTANHTITIEQLAQAQQISSGAQGSESSALGLSGTLTINGKNITVASTDTMLDLRDNINSAGAGVNATIVSADSTHNYLILTSNTTGTGTNAINLTETALSDTMGITTTGTNNPADQLTKAQNAIIDVDGIMGINRSSNVISDVIDGVTLSLQKAEPNTVINLDVAPDLNSIKTDIGNFVTAYNALRAFITTQNTATTTTNSDGSTTSTFGPLYNNSIMRQISDQLQFMVSTQVKGNPDGYQSLSQIGVTMGDDFTLSIDDSTMDPALLGNVNAVASLFGFSSTSSDSRVNVVDRSSATQSGTYNVDFTGFNASGVASDADIAVSPATGSAGDGSMTNDGSNVFQASSTTGANGLTLGFTNTTANLPDVDGVQVTVQRGIADSFYDFFNSLTETGGTIDTATSDITTQNGDYQNQIDTLNDSLATEKTNLTNKYAAMETALASLSSLQSEITQFFSASSSNGGGGSGG